MLGGGDMSLKYDTWMTRQGFESWLQSVSAECRPTKGDENKNCLCSYIRNCTCIFLFTFRIFSCSSVIGGEAVIQNTSENVAATKPSHTSVRVTNIQFVFDLFLELAGPVGDESL